MQRCFFALILLVVVSPLTSAEAYEEVEEVDDTRIQGKATYGDNTPVILQNIYVNCENGDLDCYPFKGSKAITESQGVYSLTLQVESERNGTTILLSLLGENFLIPSILTKPIRMVSELSGLISNLNKHRFHQEHLLVLDAVWCYLV